MCHAPGRSAQLRETPSDHPGLLRVEVKREVYLVFVVLVQILACPLVHPCNGFADGIAGEYHSKSELETVQDQRDAHLRELECRVSAPAKLAAHSCAPRTARPQWVWKRPVLWIWVCARTRTTVQYLRIRSSSWITDSLLSSVCFLACIGAGQQET
jgi:hypothetical protein